MSLPVGFTLRQLLMWKLVRDGLSQADIARRLGITRQAVSQALPEISDKVNRTLEATARAAKIETRYIDSTKGVLLGYSHETENRVIVTFSTQHGAQIWHHHTGKCEGCASYKTCRQVLLDEANERGVTLTEEEKEKTPAQLAHIVFSKVIPGLEP